jgi:hypothetical protein
VFAKNAVNWSPRLRGLTEQNPEHFGTLPCLSSAMFFNMYSLAWRHLARAILPSRHTSVFPIYFRFLIFYLYLLPFPRLLVVSVYLLVVSVYDIDVFVHNINV